MSEALDKLEDFIQEGCSARPEDKHDALVGLSAIRAALERADKVGGLVGALREATAIITHEAAKLATGQELPSYDAADYGRPAPKWLLSAIENMHDKMRLNAIHLKKAVDLIYSAQKAPQPAAQTDEAKALHPHSYEKRVLDSIAHIRAEMAKGFYHPDKEPLEVIMYAAQESLK